MEYRTEFLESVVRTPTAVSYRFTRPDGFNFTAGQFMIVDLGDGLSHPLSLSCSPEENRFIEFTKRMSDSDFSKYLQALKKGDTITVNGPMGKFCFTDSSDTTVMIAGGIGITPMISMLASLAKKKHQGKVILLYGNLNSEDIAFRQELENLGLTDFRTIHVMEDTEGIDDAYQGFITADIISREVKDLSNSTYMVSGPPAMVEAIKKALSSLDVAGDRIRFDVFLGYA